MNIYSQWAELSPYLKALSFQEKCVSNILSKNANKKVVYVLAGSHPSVVTSGLRSQGDQDFSYKEKLLQKHFFFTKVNRGGAVTLHMPGQLVVYHILALDVFDLGIKDWVDFLKTSFAKVISKKYGLKLNAKQDGLYFKGKKMLFIGLRVKKRVSYHGISLNVNNNLESFSWIKPCGQDNLPVTSLCEELGFEANLKEIYQNWLEHLKIFLIAKTGLSYEQIKHINKHENGI